MAQSAMLAMVAVAPLGAPAEIICSVSNNGRAPILFLPSSKAAAAFPRGDVEMLINGQWAMVARVAKIAINTVRLDGGPNELPAILRGWFGDDAGSRGRRERVRIHWAGNVWVMEPVK